MIQMREGRKVYTGNGVATEAIRDMSFEIAEGEFVAIMGPSGSGKSTLLNILGGMDALTEGALLMNDVNIKDMKTAQADAFRKKNISFVFQNFALMGAYTVAENVELPLLAANVKKRERRQIVKDKLELLGIEDLAKKRADSISGGQQQRCAVARALASGASMILADEPTGALDSENSRMLMEIFKKIHEDKTDKKTIVMVTHDREMAEYADRILHIQDGRIVEDEWLTEHKSER